MNHSSRRIQGFRIQLPLRLATTQLHTLDSDLTHLYRLASRKRYYHLHQLPKFHPPLMTQLLAYIQSSPRLYIHRTNRCPRRTVSLWRSPLAIMQQSDSGIRPQGRHAARSKAIPATFIASPSHQTASSWPRALATTPCGSGRRNDNLLPAHLHYNQTLFILFNKFFSALKLIALSALPLQQPAFYKSIRYLL